MAIAPAFLKHLPGLDPAFGRGYGEEVDWCQKARAQGGRHVGIATLFVEHRGGESFGSAEKLKLVAANNARIARRYPGYDAEVQGFIAADPLVTPRLALAVAWAAAWAEAAADRRVPVYLAHSLGGGAETYLQQRIAEDRARDGRPALILRVGGARRWRLEAVSEAGVTAGETADFALIRRLLAPLARREIVYSCGVGDPDPPLCPVSSPNWPRAGRLTSCFTTTCRSARPTRFWTATTCSAACPIRPRRTPPTCSALPMVRGFPCATGRGRGRAALARRPAGRFLRGQPRPRSRGLSRPCRADRRHPPPADAGYTAVRTSAEWRDGHWRARQYRAAKGHRRAAGALPPCRRGARTCRSW